MCKCTFVDVPVVVDDVYCCKRCEVQADVVVDHAASTSTIVNETVTFNDSVVSDVGGINVTPGLETANDQTENIDLIRFLSRPVRIYNYTWLETDPIGTFRTIFPWQLFFNDARIKYKLNNFAFFQCTLKVKILINASPFYYGTTGVFYIPLQSFTPSTILPSVASRDLILYSQRPSVWLNPQDNQGAEMTLPFFYHKNWVNAQSSADITNLGKLDFINYTTLQSANGATGTGVSVSVYAWAEDVKLSGPSAGLAVQADEYGQGPVGRVSSAIANTAKHLKNVPVIGSFATATEMGASAVSSVAKLFGFTNVPVIDDSVSMRPDPFPKLATTEIGYPIEKLTVDSKNELSIDGKTVGLTSEDEMTIPYLVQKQSYLTQTTWSSTHAVDTILFSSVVTPILYDSDPPSVSGVKLFMTPMAWISNLFNNWRGDVIFTFKIIASQYHKGRLRISFDPSGYAAENILNDANTSNVVFTKIVDLADSNEVEVRIPYQQAAAFLYNADVIDANPGWSTSASPTFLYDGVQHNGTICVRVHNVLTAPIASSSVQVLVFVRGAENLEFANPRDLNNAISPFNVQSDVIGTAPTTPLDQQYLINFGEQISSLRTLLRRHSLSLSVTPPDNSTLDYYIFVKNFSRIPLSYGYDPTGIHSAKGLITPASNFPFNFCKVHPLAYILPAFVGFRGSTNWTINTGMGTNVSSIRVCRQWDQNVATVGSSGFSFASGSLSSNAQGMLSLGEGSGGCALTNQNTNSGLSVQCPNYSPYRFQSTAPSRASKPLSTDGATYDLLLLELVTSASAVPVKKMIINMYCGIGTDFGAHFFLNVPAFFYVPAVTPN
nr:MAG: putative structural polyprotein [Marnaviridae sp.]